MPRRNRSIRPPAVGLLLVISAGALALTIARPGTGASGEGPEDAANAKNFLLARAYSPDRTGRC